MITKISPEVTSIDFQNFGSIVYLIQLKVNKKKENIIIDTSSRENLTELVESLEELNLSPEKITTIILTHSHYDHIDNVDLFTKAKIYGNFTELIDRDHSRKTLKNIIPIDKLPIKEFKDFTIYKTPGHTFGDIVILYKTKDKKILFSGDVIFNYGMIGRTDFPESRPADMKKSLKLVNELKFDILCPGH
jgi:N-acyl homoserine lactone hydrolase